MALEEQLEMAMHNLLCYSKNYLMTEPKPGFEQEHQDAVQEVERLERLLNQETLWNAMQFDDRLELAFQCGWAKRTARRIARSSWELLSPAAQKVIERKAGRAQ